MHDARQLAKPGITSAFDHAGALEIRRRDAFYHKAEIENQANSASTHLKVACDSA
jgi:hypothetical protein